MAVPRTPNYHGRKLLRELKRLREQAGMTRERAGDELRMTPRKLSRIENGQLPKYHETQVMLKVYHLRPEQWPEYLTLWELARKPGWWQESGPRDCGYIGMEQQASTMTEFRLGLLPELLQTESYARTSLAHTEDSDTEAITRIRRQHRLFTTESPLRLHTLIHEPVLYQGVDREQLLQLVERADMPNVTLQVVPQSAGLHDGLTGSAILLEFDDPQEPALAFTETVLGLSQAQNEATTSAIQVLLRRLTELAMGPEDSLDMVKSLVK
ncbi:transcriptional regulator with XRE-family HTH domain [Kibdelosporangium banguiense]|uniref:Transcriptional regulator with XRE-family HTH domain n=1 Tax=Kibdelosporangium banguiense TaxID=1365924 RepID=A0ABS4TK40_9PSEU|nr:helix-turn-helix transcriptional regulator [Kibdelosporangium banguiense]MBP2324778.1 transcriptional regulator with XRE-family HTH domain [Kibdelosporangium banguiense]